MDLKDLQIDKQWTLFLDRDGVINRKLEADYVKSVEEFEFIEGSKEAIAKMNTLFGRAVVVTNQQGIGKGLMTKDDLKKVHQHMQEELAIVGGMLDEVYFCPELAESNSICRKPNTGMAEEARKDFPEIDFKKSIMVGDSLSDMQMGKRVGMITVFVTPKKVRLKEADYQVESLAELCNLIIA
ncbi:MAG: HAD family hydrolase [Vicingaceae bacterium]